MDLAWRVFRPYDSQMSAIGMRRIIGAIGCAALFGVLTSVLKGDGPGARDAVGNVSATWLIVPLLAGWYAAQARLLAGALVGLAVTMTAIVGFYGANAFVLHLGSHSTLHDLGLSLHPGLVLAPYGVVTGVAFGATGAWCRGRRSAAPGWIAAALLILEPAVLVAYFRARGIGLSASFGNPWVWVGEIAVGLLVAAVTWRRAAAGPHDGTPRHSEC